MARSIDYWKDLLSKSQDSAWNAERTLRFAQQRHDKNGSFVKKHGSWQSEKRKPGYKVTRIEPVVRRGKTIYRKYWSHNTAVGDRIYIKRSFYFKRPHQYELAYKQWLKFTTRMSLLRKELAKLQRKIAYCKAQISRLESK